jgi:ribosomal protein S27AE
MSADEVELLDFIMELPGVQRESYEDWPVTFMDPDKLAAAGFYYINHGDVVRCPFCKAMAALWTAGEDPLVRHKRLSPNCSLIAKHVDEGVCVIKETL